MATSSMVPYSNPAGNNQTSPASMIPKTTAVGASGGPGVTVPGASMGTGPGAAANPFMPTGAVPTAATSSGTPQIPGTTAPGGPVDPNQQLMKQFTDIFGKGTGGSLVNMFSNMSGTDSQIFQQFLSSMAPREAQEKADFGQAMGAAGVSPNSTVSALGLSNLQAKDFATEAGVDAQLMQQNQQNQLGILQGAQQASVAEVAQSPWDTFAQVAGAVGNLAAPFTGGISSMAGKLFSGGKGVTPGPSMSAPQLGDLGGAVDNTNWTSMVPSMPG